MVTLDKIVMDILKIARGSNVPQSETISTRQIEDWINQYRALLISQKVEKGYDLNSSLIQSLNCLELEDVDKAECCDLGFNTCTVKRTKIQLPRFAMSKTDSELIIFVGTVMGKPIQLMSEIRSFFNQYRKYTKHTPIAYKKNDYLYILNDDAIERVTIRGILADPREASTIINSCSNTICWSVSDPYPIVDDMVPTIRGLILEKEMGIIIKAPSDKKNDSSNIETPNSYTTKS